MCLSASPRHGPATDASYMRLLDDRMKQLAAEGNFPMWE
jgi:hypothetical protein